MIRRANKQQMFETSVTHMIKQGVQAVIKHEGEPTCEYHTPEGLSCAVGCLITKKEYRPAMEGDRIAGVVAKFDHLPKIFYNERYFLAALQDVHDDYMDHGFGVDAMHAVERVAADYNLSLDFLQTTEMESLIARRKIDCYNAKRKAYRAAKKRAAQRAAERTVSMGDFG